MFYITFINTHHKFYLEPLTAIVSVKQIVKVIILICVAVTVAYTFFNALKKRSEDKQKELDTYAEKLRLEKIKIQQGRRRRSVEASPDTSLLSPWWCYVCASLMDGCQ